MHGGSLSSTVMTLLLTKFEKILNGVSFSIFTCFSTFALENNLFQSIMFKAFRTESQTSLWYGGGYIICRLNLAYVI